VPGGVRGRLGEESSPLVAVPDGGIQISTTPSPLPGRSPSSGRSAIGAGSGSIKSVAARLHWEWRAIEPRVPARACPRLELGGQAFV
jgi:hypothetical protein